MLMLIEGYSTYEGAVRYRQKFQGSLAHDFFHLSQGLLMSSIGIGTYLDEWDNTINQRQMETIIRAFQLGCNVIDTAANYRFQKSERLIGKAVNSIINTHLYKRDEIILCTKGGYLPFENEPPLNSKEFNHYVEDNFVRTKILQQADLVNGIHCIAPLYLQNQIDASRTNMNVSTIDVYYLHNPEIQLLEISRLEFEKRLYAAFDQLERNIVMKKIKSYGIATWSGFRVSPDKRDYLSLARIVKIARDVGGISHGFRFIQLPFNLAMTEALRLCNQITQNSSSVAILEAADALKITVIASASILQGQITKQKLPDAIYKTLGFFGTNAQTAVQFVRSAPGITTALVGMSHINHAEENLKLSGKQLTPLKDYKKLFELK